MKKKILLAAVMVLWLMVFSTMLSFAVERLMTPQVTVTGPRDDPNSMKSYLALSCLLENSRGAPCLYQTYEGLGTDKGTVAAVAPPDTYMVEEKEIRVLGGGYFISGATKPLAASDPVEVVRRDEKRDDLWLAIPKEGSALKNDLTVLCQTDHAILLAAEAAPAPFMENTARSLLFEADGSQMKFERVYSRNDIFGFLKGLRLAAACFGLGAFALVLWAASCFQARNAQKNRTILSVNAGLFLLSLAAAGVMLHFLALPGSLLPVESIVDFSHYKAEYHEMLSALQALAPSSPEAAELVSSIHRQLVFSLVTVTGFPLIAVTVVLIEYQQKRSIFRSNKPYMEKKRRAR